MLIESAEKIYPLLYNSSENFMQFDNKPLIHIDANLSNLVFKVLPDFAPHQKGIQHISKEFPVE